jgi:hypothetical protein
MELTERGDGVVVVSGVYDRQPGVEASRAQASRVRWTSDIEAAVDPLRGELRTGDLMVVKAPWAVGLKWVATAQPGEAVVP